MAGVQYNIQKMGQIKSEISTSVIIIGHLEMLKYRSVLKVGRLLPEKRQIVSDVGHISQIVLEEGLLDKIKIFMVGQVWLEISDLFPNITEEAEKKPRNPKPFFPRATKVY